MDQPFSAFKDFLSLYIEENTAVTTTSQKKTISEALFLIVNFLKVNKYDDDFTDDFESLENFVGGILLNSPGIDSEYIKTIYSGFKSNPVKQQPSLPKNVVVPVNPSEGYHRRSSAPLPARRAAAPPPPYNATAAKKIYQTEYYPHRPSPGSTELSPVSAISNSELQNFKEIIFPKMFDNTLEYENLWFVKLEKGKGKPPVLKVIYNRPLMFSQADDAVITPGSVMERVPDTVKEVLSISSDDNTRRFSLSMSIHSFSQPRIIDVIVVTEPSEFVKTLIRFFTEEIDPNFYKNVVMKKYGDIDAETLETFNLLAFDGNSEEENAFWDLVFPERMKKTVEDDDSQISSRGGALITLPWNQISNIVRKISGGNDAAVKVEIEGRFYNIDFKNWSACLAKLKSKLPNFTVCETTDRIYNFSNFKKAENKTLRNNYELKEKRLSINLPYGFGFKLDISTEQSFTENQMKMENLDRVFNLDVFTTREKHRHSFSYFTNEFIKIDLTETLTTLPNASFSFKNYEIEVDLTMPANSIIRNENLVQFRDAVIFVFSAIFNSPYLFTSLEYNNVINHLKSKTEKTIKNFSWENSFRDAFPQQFKNVQELMQMEGKISSDHNSISKIQRERLIEKFEVKYNQTIQGPLTGIVRDGFLLKRPVNIKVDHIMRLSIFSKYAVSVKADGITRFVYFDKTGIYTFFPPNKFEKVYCCVDGNKKMPRELIGTILIGEYIPKENRINDTKTSETFLLVFDEFDPTETNYLRRYKNAHGKLKKLNDNVDGIDIIIKIELKPIYVYKQPSANSETENDSFLLRDTNALQTVKLFNEITSPENNSGLKYTNDGLIFTPIDNSYGDVLKLKPFSNLTIDFGVDREAKVLTVNSSRGGAKPILTEFRGTVEQPFVSEINVDWNSIPADDDDVGKTITIAEFFPTVVNEFGKKFIVMSFARFRNSDKTVPNALSVAIETWHDINAKDEMISFFDVKNNLLRLRRYHNMIKSKLFAEYHPLSKESSLLVDIGTGNGGDISKFKNFRRAILVEPNLKNLETLKKRLSNAEDAGLIKRNFYELLNTGGEDYEAILEAVRAENPNNFTRVCISLMLSLTFFFDPSNTELLDGLIKTIKGIAELTTAANVPIDIIFLTAEGSAVRNVMKTYGTRDPADDSYSMIKKNFQIKLESDNSRVYIHINNSIVDNQTEYLVDLDILMDRLNNPQQKTLSAMVGSEDIFLSSEERILNQMYVYGTMENISGKNIKKMVTTKPLTMTSSPSSFVFDTSFVKFADFVLNSSHSPPAAKKKKEIGGGFLPLHSYFTVSEDNNTSQLNNLNNKSERIKDRLYEEFLAEKKKVDEKWDHILKPYDKSIFNYHAKKLNISVFTNAWLKMHEMINYYPKLLKPSSAEGRPLNVFCNSELPGAFISAILYNRRDTKWKASSLYLPVKDDSVFLGDSYNVYKNNKKNWLFNEWMNGDITNYKNQLFFKGYFEGRKVDVYTSDVGIAIPENEHMFTEEANRAVNLGQTVTALLTLAKGGNAVFKTYFPLSEFGVSILYHMLYSNFETMSITKPLTSRIGNSEIYYVCFGFKGISEEFETRVLKYAEELFSPEVLGKVSVKNRTFLEKIFEPEVRPDDRFLNSVAKAQISIFEMQQKYYLELLDFHTLHPNITYTETTEIFKRTVWPRTRSEWLAANPMVFDEGVPNLLKTNIKTKSNIDDDNVTILVPFEDVNSAVEYMRDILTDNQKEAGDYKIKSLGKFKKWYADTRGKSSLFYAIRVDNNALAGYIGGSIAGANHTTFNNLVLSNPVMKDFYSDKTVFSIEIYLKNEYKRRGIGSNAFGSFLTNLRREFKSVEIFSIMASVYKDNSASIDFFTRKLAFTKIAENSEVYIFEKELGI